jgi:ABC-2 type transport system permease protein
MSVMRAFLWRDFRVAWSYRMSFVFQTGSLFFSLVTLRFMSDLFGQSDPSSLASYGGDYFSFVILGMGISLMAYPVTKSFAGAVRAAQMTGTFEAMLTTRTPAIAIVFHSGLYPVVVACIQLVAMWLIAGVALGANFRVADLALVVLVLVLTLAVLAGIGLLSAAFAIAFKQNEPFTTAFLAGSLLVSGIMYPTSVLPGWLEKIAVLLPLTHAAELTRLLFLQGADTTSVGVHFAALVVFALSFPLGLFALNHSINWARRCGSLSQY